MTNYYQEKTEALFKDMTLDTNGALLIKDCFEKHCNLSFTLEDILNYIHFRGFKGIDSGIQKELTALVRAKILRSRTQNKKRFYEVNY